MGTFLLAFGGGMVSFLSPCVLPLVPGYLSLMSGVSLAELGSPTAADTRRLLRSTLLFVAGFTIVFVALGASASALGQLLLENKRVLERVAGVLVIAMGLFLAGVIAPGFLQRERRFDVLPSKLGAFAPPVMGMAFAFGWTPCIGPSLAAVLALATNENTLGRGVALLFVYSLGLGVPFVAAGLAFGRLTEVFAWVKRHFRALNVTSGAVLTIVGILLFTGRMGRVSSFLIDAMDRVGLDWLSNIG
ncbi:MAG TPA: cytochrome c biogenesis protein CcdA [Acidimicrobiales bacterium]|nr:cytochrome c biogenesis protein CcdA [Acidimicrobiales bacterium]